MSVFLEEALRDAKKVLREAGIDSWAIDGDVLMAHALGMRRESLITENRRALSEDELGLFNSYVERRQKLMPVAYIINRVEFMGLDFFVDEDVLIPRPDTETLVEAAIERINKSGAKTVLDMCTGSGAIAISIAHYCPKSQVSAVDISQAALKTAKKNAGGNGVQIDFIASDMFEDVEDKFDIIVSNPPYISGQEMTELSDNVSNYEPHLALFGGVDGLGFYRRLSKSGKYLQEKGVIIIEIGAYQKNDIVEIFRKEGFCLHSVFKDLAGLDRTLIFGENRIDEKTN